MNTEYIIVSELIIIISTKKDDQVMEIIQKNNKKQVYPIQFSNKDEIKDTFTI